MSGFDLFGEFREIKVTVTAHSLRVEPETFSVPRGRHVVWSFFRAEGMPRLRFNVYFDGDSPFPWKSIQLEENISPQLANSLSARAETPGEYKYGIRVEDAVTGQLIEDEDPYLLVTAI